jgi:ELWxxDGT repeat protein
VATALATVACAFPAGSFAATESLVRDINPGAGDSAPYDLANVAGTLYFNAADATHHAELWRSDGTAPGTRLVRDVDPGDASSFPQSLANLQGTLLLQATSPSRGAELWKAVP